MPESRTRYSTCAPRVLLILFALFLTVFSLDVIALLYAVSRRDRKETG